MKLRRNEMKLRKNFSFPTWTFQNPHLESELLVLATNDVGTHGSGYSLGH